MWSTVANSQSLEQDNDSASAAHVFTKGKSTKQDGNGNTEKQYLVKSIDR